MKIYKAYKFRLYPSNEQKHYLNTNFGCTRFVYNHYLNKKEDYYKKYKKNLSLKEMKHDLSINLKVKHPWLRECDSMALFSALDNLDRAYTNFFEKRADKPKFKYKGGRDSYKTNCIRGMYKGHFYENIKVDIKNKLIKLPKMGYVPIKGYRGLVAFPWKILSVTLSREANKYYVSVLVEQEVKEENIKVKSAIGLDLGIKDLVINADGMKYKRLDISRIEKRIKGLQKHSARCVPHSNNSLKIKNKISRAYMKMKNMRKYYIHEITKNIVNNNDLIAVETLDIKNMIQSRKETKLSKYINYASWNTLINTLKYKCKWNNKVLVNIHKYYASSQICNVCGHKNKEVKDLSIREYRCTNCKSELDRDINASINILWRGINKYFKTIEIS